MFYELSLTAPNFTPDYAPLLSKPASQEKTNPCVD